MLPLLVKLLVLAIKAGIWAVFLEKFGKGILKKAYVDADIVANKARIGGLVARTDNGYDGNGVNKYAFTSQSVVKGTIKVKTPVEVGGFISKNYPWGRVLDTVTMMKVENGEEFYGSKDLVDDDGYFTNNWIDRNYVVTGVSEGKTFIQIFS